MKPFKHLHSPFAAVLTGLFFIVTTSYAQDYQKSYPDSGKNTVQNSVLAIADNEIITAGTVTSKDGPESTDIEIKKIDAQGEIVWRKIYNFTEFDHCYSVAAADKGYVITGSVKNTDYDGQRVLIMKVDENGEVLNQNVLKNASGFEVPAYSQGLDIIQRESGNYLVAAFGTNSDYDAFNTSAVTGFIFEVDTDLNFVKGMRYDSTVFNTIVKAPYSGIDGDPHFLTGTIFGSNDATATGALINNEVDLVWKKAIEYQQGVYSYGASAVFEPEADQVYFLTNDTHVHQFNVIGLDNTGGITSYLTNPTWELPNDFTGISIFLSPAGGNLIIAGFNNLGVDIEHNGVNYTNNPVGAFEIDNAGAIVWDKMYKTLSAGYVDKDYDRTKGLFSIQPSTSGPGLSHLPIYTPNIATLNSDGDLIILGYSNQDFTNTTYYELNVMRTALSSDPECPVDRDMVDLATSPYVSEPTVVPTAIETETEEVTADIIDEKLENYNCVNYECGQAIMVTEYLNCNSLRFNSFLSGSNGATSYFWNLGNGAVSTLSNPSRTYQPGTYTVTLTINSTTPNGYPCTSTVSKTITISTCRTTQKTANYNTTGLADVVAVYPNPSNGKFTITAPSEEYTIEVTDLTGRVILKQKATSSNSRIDLSKTSKGVYILKVTNEGKTTVNRIVVE